MWLLYDDFIDLLRRYFDRWPWWIDPDGAIRTETIDGADLDPITALYASVQQVLVDPGSYASAARSLGLDRETADAIAQASDLAENYNAHVRADLIGALRLSEQWGRQGRWGDRAFSDEFWPHQYDRPLRHGSGSPGSASVAARLAPSKFMAPVRSGVSLSQPRGVTAGPPAAVWISPAWHATPKADCWSISVAPSLPGSASARRKAA